MRVLYSFPLRFNKKGIGLTAWHQVSGLVNKGVQVDLFCASCDVDIDSHVNLKETLIPFGLRIPLRLLGYKAFILHDIMVKNYLKKHFQNYDIVHCWPSGGLATLRLAKQLGLRTFTERPNSHTEHAHVVVQRECEKLHYTLPKTHSHSCSHEKLNRENEEFGVADKLLCPSQFVYDSYIQKGFAPSRLALHHYGYDPDQYYPTPKNEIQKTAFRAVFIGSCGPRKGLHYALKAWLNSKACKDGQFIICGSFVEGYRDLIREYLEHPSIKEVGYVSQVREMLSGSDIMILPTIEEGSALVTYEARACGCVILVSSAAGAWGKHQHDLMIHQVGDVDELTRQINSLYQDEKLLEQIKVNSLTEIKKYTWDKAADVLLDIYKQALRAGGAGGSLP